MFESLNDIHRMFIRTLVLVIFLSSITAGLLQAQQNGKVVFTPYFIAAESFETVGVFDVDNDGKPDLVSGDFFYLNSDEASTIFRKRHRLGQQKAYGEYFDDFATIPLDVNQDGRMDFITGGWFGEELRWHENVGADGEWPAHIKSILTHPSTVL